MKRKLIFILFSLIFGKISYAQDVTNSQFAIIGQVRDHTVMINGKMYYITNNATNNFQSVVDCNGVVTQVKLSSNWANTQNAECIFYTVGQSYNSFVTSIGNVKLTNGDNALLVSYDPITDTSTALTQFLVTGPNKDIGVKLNGTFISSTVIRVFNETNLASGINSVTIPPYGVADLNLTTGAVTLRNDLVLYDGASPTQTYCILRMNSGKILHTGNGLNRTSFGGPSAQHGFIEDPGTSTFTDLGFPGGANVAVTKAIQMTDGNVYIGHNFSSPSGGLTPIGVKMNPVTFAISPLGTNLNKLTVTDMVQSGDWCIFAGVPKPTGPTGSMFAYNIISGLWQNWSGTLYSNPGTSSVVASIVAMPCSGGCQNPISIAANFVNGSGGQTESPFTNVAKSCSSVVVLSVKLQSFSVSIRNNDALIEWALSQTEIGAKLEIQRSSNGIDFKSIYNENDQVGNKLIFNHVDHSLNEGAYYYRLKIVDKDGKFSFSKIEKVIISKNGGVSIFPNPSQREVGIKITSSEKIKSIKLFMVSGELVKEFVNINTTTTFFNFPQTILPGTYALRVEVPSRVVTQNIVIF
jgi:hypothetical protein